MPRRPPKPAPPPPVPSQGLARRSAGWVQEVTQAHPVRVAVAAFAGIATVLGTVGAVFGINDRWQLKTDAVQHAADEKAAREDLEAKATKDVAEIRRGMEVSRLYNELGRLGQDRKRLEKSTRDLAYKRTFGGGKLTPAEEMSSQADRAELDRIDALTAETRRALNTLKAQ